jgi:hypothetical protein
MYSYVSTCLRLPRHRALSGFFWGHVLAFQSSVMFLLVSLLFVSSAEGGPEQIPQHLVWVPWAPPGLPFGSPWASPGRFLVPLGTSWSPLGPFLGPRRKKRRKVTWRTLASGSKLGLKIVTFPKKAATNMKKWAPRQGLQNRPCLEGVKSLKVMTLTALWAVF